MQFPLPDPTKTLFEQDVVTLMSSIIMAESANQTDVAKLGVAFVMRNRWLKRTGFGHTYIEILTRKNAFSCTSPTNPTYQKLLNPLRFESPLTWQKCYLAAAVAYYGLGLPDPTNGAHFYFSPPCVKPPRDWGAVSFTTKIDHLSFYRIAPQPDSKAA